MFKNRWAMQVRDGNTKEESKANARNKNIIREMKNAHNGLASRLDMARGRISQAGNMSVETSHIELQKEKRMQERRMSRHSGTLTKGVIYE